MGSEETIASEKGSGEEPDGSFHVGDKPEDNEAGIQECRPCCHWGRMEQRRLSSIEGVRTRPSVYVHC